MKKEELSLYVSPKVKTVEIKTQAIICQSIDPYYDPFSGDGTENL